MAGDELVTPHAEIRVFPSVRQQLNIGLQGLPVCKMMTSIINTTINNTIYRINCEYKMKCACLAHLCQCRLLLSENLVSPPADIRGFPLTLSDNLGDTRKVHSVKTTVSAQN